MSLYIVATPIGNPKDITLRALELLTEVKIVIGEDPKPTKRMLSSLKVGIKELYFLNEHSSDEDLLELVNLCKENEVALITDCGTPGFCDPGAKLIKACRKTKIKITSLPGASSLMCLISMSSEKVEQCYMAGFLPAKEQDRNKKLKDLSQMKEAIVIMETPYRLNKLIQNLSQYFPQRKVLIALNATSEEEQYIESNGSDLTKLKIPAKAEPIVLIYPQ